ncbi:MAG: sensor histidine kinase [Anaeroplasma sp.]
MKKYFRIIVNFFVYVFIIGLNISLAFIGFTKFKDQNEIIALLFMLCIICSSFMCIITNIIFKKITIDKDIKEIIIVLNELVKGNFDVRFNNIYDLADELDIIKANINYLAKELANSKRINDDFVSNLSHEIKTPLAIIQSYSSLLEHNINNNEKENYLQIIKNACFRLNNLISNILKLNKLENQVLKLEYKRFNLSESVINQILQYEVLIERKNINLDCNIEDGIYIDNEEDYLNIIWNNLISNAIKFTDDMGSIKISLAKKNNEIIFKIQDSGCGINNETGKHIFEKFYQGDTSHSKEGNGLGLALVKKVIDLIGGKIEINSEVGIGTTFIVKLKED